MSNFKTVPTVNKITDSEPLTYDKINEIIEAIRLIRGNLNTLQGQSNDTTFPKIDVVGNGLDNVSQVSIRVDSKILKNFNDVKTKEVIEFNKTFKSTPIVVAMLRKTDNDSKEGKVPYATITLINVTKNSFEIEVELLKSSPNTKNIRVDYIAVGQS